METTRIDWHVTAYAECPHCKYDNDFMDEDEYWHICNIAENKEFDEPYVMNCMKCEKDFEVTGSDY